MFFMVNHPRVLSIVCALVMWLLARLGTRLQTRLRGTTNPNDQSTTQNLSLVLSATLTLLGLIIGFTFSMATSRYDQRKLYEEQEANAIGTEYVRADLLPDSQAANVRALLSQYLAERIHFYNSTYNGLDPVDARTAATQAKLWRAILPQATAAPTPVTALVVSGMNDVLNSQGYTQFAWWNRIPTAAWGLMVLIAFAANLLVGYATSPTRDRNLLLIVLPVIVAISFFLVADIDSPRGGIIRVHPRNLEALVQTLPQLP